MPETGTVARISPNELAGPGLRQAAVRAAVPAGHQCAPTAVPHREVRGSAGAGEPVEVAPRAGAARPGRRRERRAG